jgi:hypothetical protein
MLGQSLQTFLSTRLTCRVFAGVLVTTLLTVGCTDVRDYTGIWRGNIVRSEYLRHGFDSDTSVELTVVSIDRSTMTGHLRLTPSQDSTSGFDATLIPVVEAENDALGDMDFDGDPLATYIFFVSPVDTSEASALVILSAHSGDRMEMRILRHDLYGVFKLKK